MMNIIPSSICWISVLDDMLHVAVVSAILSGSACVIMLAAYAFSVDEEEKRKFKKALAAMACVFAASIVAGVFTSSAKTCAAMYVIPAIANSEKLQGVTDGIYDLAAEWIKELKPAKSNGEKGEGK